MLLMLDHLPAYSMLNSSQTTGNAFFIRIFFICQIETGRLLSPKSLVYIVNDDFAL